MARVSHHKVRALAHIADKIAQQSENNPAALRMLSEINRLRLGAEALDNVQASRSPLDTPEAHAKKVAALVKKYNSEGTAAINRLGAICREGEEAIQRRIAEKVDLRPNAFAEEIRSAFRPLPRSEKVEILGQLVKENRGPELAAIIKAPSLLSGISDLERANFERSILNMHAGDEMDELKGLESVFDQALTAVNVAAAFTKELTDPVRIREIERGEAEAKAASDAFDQSLQ